MGAATVYIILTVYSRKETDDKWRELSIQIDKITEDKLPPQTNNKFHDDATKNITW